MRKQFTTYLSKIILSISVMIYPCLAFSQLINWINYTSKNEVSDILSDGEYLWIATEGGLIKLNKSTKEKIFYDRTGGLPDNHLKSLAKDKEGNIWVTSKYYGVGKFDGTKWQTYKESNSGISSQQWCTAITIDEDNNKWIGCLLALNKFDGKNWQSWTTPSSELANRWLLYALTFDNDNTLWVGAESPGFYFGKFTGTGIQVFNEIHAQVRSIVVDKDNNKWLASQEGLVKFDGKNFTKYNKDNSDLPSNIVLDAKKDAAGNIWLTSNNYLVKYDGINFSKYKTPMINDPIYCIEVDADNTIWIGTYWEGFFKFKDGVFEQIDISNSPLTTNNIAFSLQVDSDDNVWFGTENSLTQIDKGNNWHHHYYQKRSPVEAERRVNAVATDKLGSRWVALGRSDTCVLKISANNQVTAFTDKNSILVSGSAGTTMQFLFDKKGNTWAASVTGLLRYDGTKWERFTTQNSPLKANSIGNLVMDKEGNIWGGAAVRHTGDDKGEGGCLFKYDGTNWTIYTSLNSGLPTNYVVALAFDSKNNLWIGCYDKRGAIGRDLGGGLTKFDGTTWTTYTRENSGLLSNTMMGITVDKNDNLWLATYGVGVTKYDGTNWQNYDVDNSGIAFNEVATITFDYPRDLVWFTHLNNGGISTAKFNDGSNIESNKLNHEDSFSLYYDPLSTEVKFRFNESFLPQTIEIFDALGKSVYTNKLLFSEKEHSFTLSELHIHGSGLYLVKVSNVTETHSRKLLIAK